MAEITPNREFDIKQLYTILAKHIFLFLGIVIIVLAFTAAYLYKAKRVYSATATLEIEPRTANILGRQIESVSSSSSDFYWSNKEYYATQYEIIKSRAVSSKAIESISPQNVFSLFGIDTTLLTEEQLKDLDPIAMLQARIQVEPQKNSNIVRVSIRDTDPEKAAYFANSVSTAYIDFNFEKRYIATKDAARWLSEQSINLKKQLEESELLLFNFKKEHEVLSSAFEQKQSMLAQNISDINKKLTEKQIYLQALQAKIKELSQMEIKDPEEFFSSEASFNSNLIQNLKGQYTLFRTKLLEKRQVYGDKHPEIMAIQDEIAHIKQRLVQEISGIVEGYRSEEKTLQSEIKNLQGMLADAQKEALNLNKLEIDYNKLKREVETNKKLYDIVLERTKEADLSSLLRTNNIRIIDKALVPKFPVQPKKNLVLLIGFIIAILAGLGAVFMFEFFDVRIRDIDELEQIVGRNVLGVFPTFMIEDKTKIQEIAFEGSSHSPAVESLRTIRTNIRLSHPDLNAKTLLITSSMSQEGKTTVSANVAVSFSLAGRRVLLVDTDMRKPRTHKVFGIENKQGISNYMLGEKTLEQVIHKQVYGNLDILMCGPIPPNPSEMLESKRFREMVDKLKEMYDLVIFDSPPVIAVSDAAILSAMMDGVIIVTKIRHVSRDIIKRSIAQLKKSSGNLLGAVVNNVDLKQGSRYGTYYYYYHEKYKYYGETPEKKDS